MALAPEERRLLMDLARTVPAILLLVGGTSGKAVESIKCAREIFAGKKWGFDDSDDPATPPPDADGGGNGSVGGEPVDGDDHRRRRHQRWRCTLEATSGSQAQPQARLPREVSLENGGYWADVLASALAPDQGHLPVAYREITRLVSLHAEAGHVFVNCAARLVSLHAEAGHVFVNCAARLGFHPDDDDDEEHGGARIGLDPLRAALWKRRMNLREAAVCHAHDALLALSSAAAAIAAAEDFLRWRSADSPRRQGWRSGARQLVKDARRSLGDAKDAARLMRDAVLCEFFVTWMILTRLN